MVNEIIRPSLTMPPDNVGGISEHPATRNGVTQSQKPRHRCFSHLSLIFSVLPLGGIVHPRILRPRCHHILRSRMLIQYRILAWRDIVVILGFRYTIQPVAVVILVSKLVVPSKSHCTNHHSDDK